MSTATLRSRRRMLFALVAVCALATNKCSGQSQQDGTASTAGGNFIDSSWAWSSVNPDDATLPLAGSYFELPQHRLDTIRNSELVNGIIGDHRKFYGAENLQCIGVVLVTGALMANTSFDREFHHKFQSSVRGATSDEWFEFLHANKDLGDGRYSLPVFATAWGAKLLFPDSEVAEAGSIWGERCLRSVLVGGPPLLLLQSATGGSRPDERSIGSQWTPFRDDNGVSGHSFMSAIPFITAAEMADDRRTKFLLYGASSLGTLSRINDGAHYFSQALLGWGLAYFAADAVAASDAQFGDWDVECTYGEMGTGISISRAF